MFKRRMVLLLVLCMLFSILSVTAHAEGTELDMLIKQLPEVSDPMGTEYYFYNQLTDVEKVMYWKISEATWENPDITISGLVGYSSQELNDMANRAVTALIADKPMKHLLWHRWSVDVAGFDGNTLVFRPAIENRNRRSEYLIRKSEARIRQIVQTVGTEGDTYSRTRDMLELLHQEMDYDPYYPFGSNRKSFYNDSAIGCLVYGNAVCAGFSDTVKILCDELKIPCITVGNAGHAWNYVRMDDGQWYAVDASRDIPFDWANNNFFGSDSPNYVGTSVYFLSDLYHGEPGDFNFPVLSKTEYVYGGEYAASYHEANFDFEEPAPTFVYEVNRDGESCTIVGYEGVQSGDLNIPGSIDEYTVTAIGDAAFYRNGGFTGKLIIPDSVKEIGPCAFQACTGLSGELVLSQGLESIGEFAFLGNTSMTGSLDFPITLASIGRCAFYDCESITGDVVLPEGITLGDEIFCNCKSLTGTLYLPDNMVWDGNITNESGITSIHVNETSENYATYDGVLYSKDMKTLLACPAGKTGNLVIPEGVETIFRLACYYCKKLSGSLILPESVKTIGEWAFWEATFEGEIYIPKTVTYIGNNAMPLGDFFGSLELKDTDAVIEEDAFSGMKFLDYFSCNCGIEYRVWDLENGTLYACSRCAGGYIAGHNFTPPHTFDQEKIDAKYMVSEATCTEQAVYKKSCKCGKAGTETFKFGELKKHVFDQEKIDDKYLVGKETDSSLLIYKKSCKCGEAGEETFKVKFKDVPKNAYYHDAVMWAVEKGITTGTGDGTTFEPNAICTRGQVVTFLWRAAGKPEPDATENPFKDVTSTDYFHKAVLWAVENGITNGTGDGTTFEPNSNCNRAQIVTFLSRAKNGQPTSENNPFMDVPAGSYYYNPVLWAVEKGITTGTGDGTTFEPNSDCTRGQVITFLYRAYK